MAGSPTSSQWQDSYEYFKHLQRMGSNAYPETKPLEPLPQTDWIVTGDGLPPSESEPPEGVP